MSSRGWCFTLNNYTLDDEEKIQNYPCDYMLYGRELAPDTQTPHLQGYLYIKKKASLRTLKLKLSANAHFEQTKGSPEANYKYCTKGGDFFEKGEMPKHGQRNDLLAVKESIDSGASTSDLWENHFQQMTLYNRSFQSYRTAKTQPRSETPYVLWLWGKPGSGKTRFAYESSSDPYFKDASKWWDNYYGQHTIVIDDIRADSFSYRYLLRLLDRYPFQVQTKGGYTHFNSSVIIITSPFHPKHFSLSMSASEDPKQLLRRITHVQYCVA